MLSGVGNFYSLAVSLPLVLGIDMRRITSRDDNSWHLTLTLLHLSFLAQTAPSPRIAFIVMCALTGFAFVAAILHEEIHLVNDIVHDVLRDLLLVSLADWPALLARPPTLSPTFLRSSRGIAHLNILSRVVMLCDRNRCFSASEMCRWSPETVLAVAEVDLCCTAEET